MFKNKKKHPPKKKSRNIFRFNWKNIKISRKYITVYLLSTVLIVLAGGLVYLQLNEGQKNIKALDVHNEQVDNMSQLASIIQLKDVQIADYLLTEKDKYIDAFKDYQESFYTYVDALEPSLETKKEKETLDKIKAYDEKFNDLFFDDVLGSVEDDKDHTAILQRESLTAVRVTTVDLVEELMEIVGDNQQTAVQQANDRIDYSIITLAASIIIALVIGILAMIFISRGIAKNLNKIVHITKKVADGNLTIDSMEYGGKDEIGQLATAINQMKNNIRGILQKASTASSSVSSRSGALMQSSNEVTEGNGQVAATMEELSTGAETQANSASDLSEGMSEFVGRVQQSETNGQEIAANSDHVIQLTTSGMSLMDKSIAQMNKIDTIVQEAVQKVEGLDNQSEEISKLVRVIKNIADQTNLLSLNAAIEAARAGEHGQGFAVVADEVRKLAEQVSDSVSEITYIVTNIQSETSNVVDSLNAGYDEVKVGTTQIQETGQNFSTINESVTDMVTKIHSISSNLKDISGNSVHMNNLIEEIASVSEESAAGVEQAAASAQQTSSSMEEVASSAHELATLAEELNNELKTFTL